MRRLLLSTVALLGVAGVAVAANLALITGPIEPANLLLHLNTLVQRVNNGVSGVSGVLTTAYTTSTTGAETILSVPIAVNQMAVGQTFHYWVSGVNSADANAKTVTFNFGATTCNVVVTASGAKWVAEGWFTINGAASQATTCDGQQATTNITVGQGTGTVSIAAPVTASIQLTAATSGTMQALQAQVDAMR